jgi:hypothetical protein
MTRTLRSTDHYRANITYPLLAGEDLGYPKKAKDVKNC